MATIRTFRSTAGALALRLPVGQARVLVDPNITTVTVVLHTADDAGATADAVNRTTERTEAGCLRIDVPDIAGAVIIGDGGRVTVSGNSAVGGFHVRQTASVVMGEMTGVTIVNGRVITGNAMPVVSPIVAEITLPVDVALSFDSVSATLSAPVHLSALKTRTVSGDVRVTSVGALLARSTSGDVEADVVFSLLDVRSVSGDIEIGSYQGRDAAIGTTSGDVRFCAGGGAHGALSAHTVSGDLVLHGTRNLTVTASTVSGRKRVD